MGPPTSNPSIACGVRTSMANTLLLKPSILFPPNKHLNFLLFQSNNHLLRPYATQLNSSTRNYTLSANPKFPTKYEVKTPKSSINILSIKPNTFNSIGFILDAIANAINALKRPVIAALFVSALLLYDPKSAFAASGGVMGGSSFSEGSSTSTSTSTSSSSSSPTTDDSITCSSSDFHSGKTKATAEPYWLRLLLGVVTSMHLIVLAIYLFELFNKSEESTAGTNGIGVIKLQVGLKGTAQSLQSQLNRIAYSANTSTRKGQYYVLSETLQALVQHADYYISAYSSVTNKRSIKEGEKMFNQLSVEERGKFDEETLVNVNNTKIESTETWTATGHINEYIVVTILVAVDGSLSVPSISSSKDLEEAIQKLRSISSSETMAVQVLWTPQKENDTLSEREYLDDYPLLKPL